MIGNTTAGNSGMGWNSAPLTVVIPALNEAGRLPLLLADIAQAPAALIQAVVVVDGGSEDGSQQLTRLGGAQLLRSSAGRGQQLQYGVALSQSPWLLLLHADARLGANWWRGVQQALAAEEATWAFDLVIDAPGLMLRLLERAVWLRSRLWRLPYGDQGLLLTRSLLDRAGGIPPLPLMEDLVLIQRLQLLAPVRSLNQPIRVDGRRWQRLGVWQTTWRNARLRRAWRQGHSADALARRYYGANA
jgi:rSAM/selenodomain-associated transferase 2